MFACVNYNRSVRHTLGYNERKVGAGKAEILLAENFMKDADRLTRKDKLNRFRRLHVLNEKAKANTLHISLNFHPSDKLSNTDMGRIAQRYMKQLHLDSQPWLAYRHNDTGHPHLHIVSTLIQPDGNRLKLDDILRFESRRVTRELEKHFSLVKFYDPDKQPLQRSDQSAPLRVIYGEPGRKEAVERVLEYVIDRFSYTSLEELNAILKLYNIKAKIVWEDQAIKKAKGLMYYTLDENGRVVGVAFKSSALRSKPTLKKLEPRFAINKLQETEGSKEQVRMAIDRAFGFGRKPIGWEDVRKNLQMNRIFALPDKDKKGEWKGIYYVDMSTKRAFDGATLGGKYNSAAIRSRCATEEQLRLEQSRNPTQQRRLGRGL